MPFYQQLNTGFIEPNKTQTKRGIFRNKTHPPAQAVRPKLSNNVIPMKPDRRKFQSKILNRKEQPTESNSTIKRPNTFSLNEQTKNIVDKASSTQENIFSQLDCFPKNDVASNGSDIKTSMNGQSKNFVVNSVHSLLCQMEHFNYVKKSSASNVETSVQTLLTKGSSNELKKTKIPLVIPQVNHTSQSNFLTSNAIEIATKHLSEASFLHGLEKSKINKCTANVVTLLQKQSAINKSTANVVTVSKKDSSKQLKKLSIPTIVSSEISKSVSKDVETLPPSSVLDQLNIGDNIKLAIAQNNFQLETELKTYHEHLKKYDKEAKDVIHKFTASIEAKGKIIRKCEEDLETFNCRVYDFQQQLKESLERTRLLESKIAITEESLEQNKQLQSIEDAKNSRRSTDGNYHELQSENEKLKETLTKLETKLAKQDLHIWNLKEILTLETNKIKQLNEAQEEIIKLQRESIDKSNQISVLRDELKYASAMRSELINEYEGKVVKLKKLLAIREFLLTKERMS